MDKPTCALIRSIRQTLLDLSSKRVALLVEGYLKQFPDDPKFVGWLTDLKRQLGYSELDAPVPSDLTRTLHKMNLQDFRDTFLLLAFRSQHKQGRLKDTFLFKLRRTIADFDPTDYRSLDKNIVSLARALNSFPAVTTIGSCGGHDPILNPGQWPAGSWYMKFDIDPSELGWFVLEFLTWAVNDDYRRVHPEVLLLPIAPPPSLNHPGRCLSFVIECHDGPVPNGLAEFLNDVRPQFVAPGMWKVDDDLTGDDDLGFEWAREDE